jgi:hypothetical protein
LGCIVDSQKFQKQKEIELLQRCFLFFLHQAPDPSSVPSPEKSVLVLLNFAWCVPTRQSRQKLRLLFRELSTYAGAIFFASTIKNQYFFVISKTLLSDFKDIR